MRFYDERNKTVNVSCPHDPWVSLRAYTNARIALGRTGTAIPLKHVLDFKLAHANAKEAVHSSLDIDQLSSSLSRFNLPVMCLRSMAADRRMYLQRPDAGRKLSDCSYKQLEELDTQSSDVAIVVGDGLSALAIQKHALPVLKRLICLLKNEGFAIAPICVVEQARVAISDQIGSLLHAKITVILIGERPGLSACDSMGAYITYEPKPGLTDETRNCVSNIRPQGLAYPQAAEKIFYLIKEALRLRMSGVLLKDNFNSLKILD